MHLPAVLAALAMVSADAPAFRRVETTFVIRGAVVAQPTVLVGGPDCQTFSAGTVGEPPTVSVEYCTVAADRLRVAWTLRDGGRVLAHHATGPLAEGATFEAGIPGTIDVRVTVGDEGELTAR